MDITSIFFDYLIDEFYEFLMIWKSTAYSLLKSGAIKSFKINRVSVDEYIKKQAQINWKLFSNTVFIYINTYIFYKNFCYCLPFCLLWKQKSDIRFSLISLMLTKWRSERDSNSRTAKPPNDLANRPLQPLEYHSINLLNYYTISYIILQVLVR